MPLRITAFILLLLWSAAAITRNLIVPFPPWAYEASEIAFLLLILLYATGTILEISGLFLSSSTTPSRLFHRMALSVFLLGGVAVFGLSGSTRGLASLWIVYLFCRVLHRPFGRNTAGDVLRDRFVPPRSS